jgi:hypothetical protein
MKHVGELSESGREVIARECEVARDRLDCNELANSMSERASVRANDDVLGPVCRGEATTLLLAEMRLRFDETCKNSSYLEL